MTLRERIEAHRRAVEGCSRDDDPTAPPRKPEPLWLRRARERGLPAKELRWAA